MKFSGTLSKINPNQKSFNNVNSDFLKTNNLINSFNLKELRTFNNFNKAVHQNPVMNMKKTLNKENFNVRNEPKKFSISPIKSERNPLQMLPVANGERSKSIQEEKDILYINSKLILI